MRFIRVLLSLYSIQLIVISALLVTYLAITAGNRTEAQQGNALVTVKRIFNAGARPQRLLWASTTTKDPKASAVLYVEALAAPLTINTLTEKTLKAFADHRRVEQTIPSDGGDCETVLAQFTKAGSDVDALADELQNEGIESFVRSWNELIASTATKGLELEKARSTGG